MRSKYKKKDFKNNFFQRNILLSPTLKTQAKEILNKKINPNNKSRFKTYSSYEGYAMGIAKDALKRGYDQNDPELGILGAEVYEMLGYGNRPSVIKRLQRINDKTQTLISDDYEKRIQEFLKRNPAPKRNTIDRILGAAAITGIIGSLFFLSPKITGSAVSNSGNLDSSIMGILLFVAGIAAGFFYLKKR